MLLEDIIEGRFWIKSWVQGQSKQAEISVFTGSLYKFFNTIVIDKIMEINVFSPGGLGSAQKFEGVNFSNAVLDALKRKGDYMRWYRRDFSNNEMATL